MSIVHHSHGAVEIQMNVLSLLYRVFTIMY